MIDHNNDDHNKIQSNPHIVEHTALQWELKTLLLSAKLQ